MRLKLYFSIFIVFFIADFLECYLKSIDFLDMYAPIKPILISMGISFSVNNFLKEISKKKVHEELKEKFRTDLLLSSDSVRTNINKYITALKTLLERSFKDTNVTRDQLKEDQNKVYGYVKSLESKWKMIEKLLQGGKK